MYADDAPNLESTDLAFMFNWVGRALLYFCRINRIAARRPFNPTHKGMDNRFRVNESVCIDIGEEDKVCEYLKWRAGADEGSASHGRGGGYVQSKKHLFKYL